MPRLAPLLLLIALAGCRGDTSGTREAPAPPPRAAADTVQDMTDRPLWQGERFPDVELRDLEGNPVRTTELLGGREALVVFASITCEACHDLISTWEQLALQFPEGYPVFAIVDEEVELARRYVEEKRFPFPLYCDTESVFYVKHLLDTYPTVAGVAADGTILFMVRQASPLLTPERALRMLADAKGEHRH